MRFLKNVTLLLILAGCVSGCARSWKMDYGKPVAQFLEEDVVGKAKPYLGKKITVKGTVTKVDVSDPQSSWIHLGSGIRCNLGKFKAMAQSKSPGDTVFVDGFLKRCEENDVLVEPAMLRDPKAPFSPE